MISKLITNSHRYMRSHTRTRSRVTSRVHLCDITHSSDDTGLKVDHELTQIYAYICTHVSMSHVTHSCVGHDSFSRWSRSESWSRTRTGVCTHIRTHIYGWFHAFIRVTGLNCSHDEDLEVQISNLFTNSHSYLQIWKTRPTHMQQETSMHETRDLHICKRQLVCIKKRDLRIRWEEIKKISKLTWLIHMCDVTYSYIWRDSFICVTWLIHLRIRWEEINKISKLSTTPHS